MEFPHAHPLGQIHRKSAGSSPAGKRARLRARQSRASTHPSAGRAARGQEGIVAPVLEKIGIGPQAVLSDLYREIEKLPKVSGEASQATLSNAANKLLEQAFKEAANFKDEYVSTEHLLLAITHLKQDAAQRILARHGATNDAILKALIAVRGSQKVTDQNPEAKYQALERYARNLTEQARRGKLDPVIGRDEEIRRVVQVLSRRTK